MISTLPITVLIAARNEEANIRKCLARLSLAERLIIVDSHSSDRTCKLAAEFGAEVFQFDYSGGYPKNASGHSTRFPSLRSGFSYSMRMRKFLMPYGLRSRRLLPILDLQMVS